MRLTRGARDGRPGGRPGGASARAGGPRARGASSSRGAYPWLLLWREASWRERPRILFRALWPTRSDMLAARPETPDRVGAVVLARAARLVRGIRGLPVGIRALRSSGAGPSVTPR